MQLMLKQIWSQYLWYITHRTRFSLSGPIYTALPYKVASRAEGVKHVWFFNPFKPEFTIVIFIHYKLRIAVAILDL